MSDHIYNITDNVISENCQKRRLKMLLQNLV